jgi:tetratricopeptide (TPR) repeat protein
VSGGADLSSAEGDQAAVSIDIAKQASFRRLKRVVAKLGEMKSWPDITATLLKVGRLTAETDPGQARNLARVAVFAAGKVDHDEIARHSFLVEAECLAGDVSRRLKARRTAERSFERARRHLVAGCDVRERAYFLFTLAALREDQERDEEALALRARAAGLYGALGEIDSAAAVLSAKAALEMSRSETDEALSTLAEILALIDRGLGGHLAVDAAVSFAALKSSSVSLPEAIAILERVRARYPDRAESEEMAALHLLEGRLLTFGTRPDLAEAALERAFRGFWKLGLFHDAAVASLGLAVLFLYSKRGEDLQASVEDTVGTLLLGAGLPPSVREALTAFREAVRAGQATMTLAHAVMSYVERSEKHPNLKFIPPVPRSGRWR